MSVDIHIDAVKLLQSSGVEVKAVLNGDVEDAIGYYIEGESERAEDCLQPFALIKFPGHLGWRAFYTLDDKIGINCGSRSKFLKYVMGYCQLMEIPYKVVD